MTELPLGFAAHVANIELEIAAARSLKALAFNR